MLCHRSENSGVGGIACHRNLIAGAGGDRRAVELPSVKSIVRGRCGGQCNAALLIVCTCTGNCTACRRVCYNCNVVLLAAVRLNHAAQSNILAQCTRNNCHIAAVVVNIEIGLHADINCGRCKDDRKIRRIVSLGVKFEVIDQKEEHIGAVVVAHGDVTALTRVCAEVNRILGPVGIRQGPFVQQREGRGIGVAGS